MNIETREIVDAEEKEDVLIATGLGIVSASVVTDENGGFFSAHARSRSFYLLVVGGVKTLWELTGGTKEDRRAHAAETRASLATKLPGWRTARI